MKSSKWINIAFVCLLISIGISVYLSMHHYELLFGEREGRSFCSVSQTFDCDAVNVSAYSEAFGIPIAIWSMMAFAVELVLLIGFRALGSDERLRMGRLFLYMALGNGLVAMCMAFVSFFVLHSLCIFCASLYVLILILFICGWFMVPAPRFALFFDDLKSVSRSVALVILFLLIPVGSWVAAKAWSGSMGDNIDGAIQAALSDWRQNKQYSFFITDAPSLGDANAPVPIIEFSDYECPHCRRAAPTLEAYVNGHPGKVRLIFQSYPLDISCNPKMTHPLHEHACLLARAAWCAGKQNQFLAAHHWIFDHQDELSDASSGLMAHELHLNESAFTQCLNSPEAAEGVKAQVQRGVDADIEGTPSIFVDGRLLPGGHVVPILDAAVKETLKKFGR